MTQPIQEDRLWELHGRMLEELRLQVDRQWDLTKFFILLNGSAVAGAIALFEAGPSGAASLLMGLVFLGGVALGLAALAVMRQSKRYYRTLVAKKTLLEARLGLARPLPCYEDDPVANLAVGALATRAKIAEVMTDPARYASARIRVGSATGWAGGVLLGFVLLDAFGAAMAFHLAAGCPLAWVPCS